MSQWLHNLIYPEINKASGLLAELTRNQVLEKQILHRSRKFSFQSPLSLWESEASDHGGCFVVRYPRGMLVSYSGTEEENPVDHTASLSVTRYVSESSRHKNEPFTVLEELLYS
ncbi:hypothetical protein J6590_101129, partial [Homalodisca vitripennis]